VGFGFFLRIYLDLRFGFHFGKASLRGDLGGVKGLGNRGHGDCALGIRFVLGSCSSNTTLKISSRAF